MKVLVCIPLLSLLSLATSCGQKAAVEPEVPKPNWSYATNSCPDERTLDVYNDQEAVVIQAGGPGGQYCLAVDTAGFAKMSFDLRSYLVPIPASALPAQYHIVGTHVRLTGRKKSCYGLVTSANTMAIFGYKLEIDAVKPLTK